MNKNLLLCTIGMLAFFTSCYQPEATSRLSKLPLADTNSKSHLIKIGGSSTISPLMEKITDHFERQYEKYKFDISSSGSSEGIEGLYKGNVDIAMSSNIISNHAKSEFRTHKMEYVEFLLAGDALVFVVNVHNPVKALTKQQLAKIFTGKILNWKEVGGIDAPITVVSRDSISGTYNFIKEEVLDNAALSPKCKIVASNEDLFKKISNEQSSIGYTSFSNLDYSVEPLNVSFDLGKTFVSPRVETVNNLTYRLFRGLYLYYKPENYTKIKPFMEIAKSDTIQKMIKKNGYIPITHQLITRK